MRTQTKINKTRPLIKNDHILVIDDDELLLSAIRKRLELSNYKVTVSNNVRDAYFKLGIVKPNLILLDIVMPEINGLEFLTAINSSYLTDQVPVILMSGLSKQKLYEMGYNLNNMNYIPKPFDVYKLPMIINRTLNNLNK